MTKQTVTFYNFANVPKILGNENGQFTGLLEMIE
jgi:hypothetical protein